MADVWRRAAPHPLRTRGASTMLNRMRLTIFPLITLILPTAANVRVTYFPPELARTYYTCPIGGGGQSRPTALLSDFENRWFAQHLRAADEPSLYLQSQAKKAAVQRVIRLTWLRSFHPPVTVRIIARQGDRWHLVAKELSVAGGYKPGGIKRTVSRRLATKEVADLTVLMARSSIPDASGDCVVGLYGAEWIIERLDQDGYHFIKRWSPSDGPVYEVGLFLIDLTGWRYKEVY